MNGHRFTTDRGQALVETLVCLPLLLLSFVGVLWAIKAAVQYERLEQAVRYVGQFQESTPYSDFSLQAMYRELGSTPPTPPIPCLTPIPSQLSDGAPYAAVGTSQVVSPPIFSPSSVLKTQCDTYGYTYGIDGSSIGTQSTYTLNGKTYVHTQVEDDVLDVQHPVIESEIVVPTYLKSTLGTYSTFTSSKEYYEHGINVAQMMFCYNPTSIASLNSQVSHDTTLWASDPAPAATTTPFPAATPAGTFIAASGKCTYDGPQ